MGNKKATIWWPFVANGWGRLFSLEVIVSDQCDKKAGGDDQEKDWKRCRVSRDKAVQMVHDKVSPVLISDISIYHILLRRNNFVVCSTG